MTFVAFAGFVVLGLMVLGVGLVGVCSYTLVCDCLVCWVEGWLLNGWCGLHFVNFYWLVCVGGIASGLRDGY